MLNIIMCIICIIYCFQEFICYDDGCHLCKFAQHARRKNVTTTAQKLSETKIVIDKMHMVGHTDKWCKENCDPNDFRALDKVCVCIYRLAKCVHYGYLCILQVDTEACEQCFSWLSCYAKMTRRMQRPTFLFFILYMCDLHNIREESKIKRSYFM